MPALIFTADSGTDQLTSVAHGLVTGDGPAATRNIGGALPAPLAGVTDYWIIRIDDDNVQLALSSADAMAGTEINLSTNGTGTNVLEIGIPYRRARTYAVLSQVKSVDLNAMMDALKAMHALLTRQAQTTWELGDETHQIPPNAWQPETEANWNIEGSDLVSLGAGDLWLPHRLVVGGKIKKFTLFLNGDGAADATLSFRKTRVDWVEGDLAIRTITNPAAGVVEFEIDFESDTGVMSISVDPTAPPGHFMRGAGSFITDGFLPGMQVASTGYTNAGNNTTKTLLTVTALVMTVTDPAGLVVEAGTGNEQIKAIPPTVEAGQSYYCHLAASAANIGVFAGSLTHKPG